MRQLGLEWTLWKAITPVVFKESHAAERVCERYIIRVEAQRSFKVSVIRPIA